MKNLISGAIFLITVLELPAIGASTKATKPYYRYRDSAAARPRAAGDPVVVNAASFEPGVSPGGPRDHVRQ